jgi:23S rRNA G2445 N2-methylase RlmL
LLDPAALTAFKVRPRKKGKPSFRVIARKSGDHAFRRVDVQHSAEQAVIDHFPDWRLAGEDAQVELWVHLVGDRLVAAFRLTDNTMRQRTYRKASIPAALKPTLAYAMVLLSQPRVDDVFLDPMCGSGTILIERALAGRYRCLLGGDLDPEAVAATRENVGKRYQPIAVRRWDATKLPLEAASVSSLATNMPFGNQIGSTASNRELYPILLAEWTRVLQASGRMVLLTGERALLQQTLKRQRALVLERQISVLVRGLPASMYVLTRA